MAFNDNKAVASNDDAMWSRYHTGGAGSVVGTWADEEVFSPTLLAHHFPQYRFDAAMDHRFGNLILWFGWKT